MGIALSAVTKKQMAARRRAAAKKRREAAAKREYGTGRPKKPSSQRGKNKPGSKRTEYKQFYWSR